MYTWMFSGRAGWLAEAELPSALLARAATPEEAHLSHRLLPLRRNPRNKAPAVSCEVIVAVLSMTKVRNQ